MEFAMMVENSHAVLQSFREKKAKHKTLSWNKTAILAIKPIGVPYTTEAILCWTPSLNYQPLLNNSLASLKLRRHDGDQA